MVSIFREKRDSSDRHRACSTRHFTTRRYVVVAIQSAHMIIIWIPVSVGNSTNWAGPCWALRYGMGRRRTVWHMCIELVPRAIICFAPQIPELNSTISTRGGEDAIASRHEADLLQGCRVVSKDGESALGSDIHDSGSLVPRGSCEELVVVTEFHVNNSIPVDPEAEEYTRPRTSRALVGV